MCDCPRTKRSDRSALADPRAEIRREDLDLARLDREAREMTVIALTWVAERYGLDDADAARHLRAHAIDGTGVIQ